MIGSIFFVGSLMLVMGCFFIFLVKQSNIKSRKKRPDYADVMALSVTIIIVGGIITFFGIVLSEGYV